jgi:hypothetical protein
MATAANADGRNRTTVVAPTYNDLFDQVNALREEVRSLRIRELIPSSFSDQTNDFRILPSLDRIMPMFPDRESNFEAEDWIGSVDGMATVNN